MERVGLTVSSLMVAPGEPAHVLALLDPDSAFAEALVETRVAVIQLLEWKHRNLADAFAGLFPAPGGVFKLAEWTSTQWGPKLADSSAWCGVRLDETEPVPMAWSLLVDTVVEEIEILAEAQPLIHRRGRYLKPDET